MPAPRSSPELTLRCIAASIALLSLVACEPSSGDGNRPGSLAASSAPTDSGSSTALEPKVSRLPDDCRGWRNPASAPEVTFVARGRLFSLDPVSGSVRCIAKRDAVALEWGPRGDRLLSHSGYSHIHGPGFRRRVPGDVREMTWSRPRGTSVVYVTHDYSDLLKQDVDTGRVRDISFLPFHFDVAYHPAGTHIAVAGENHRGKVGLFLATNEGRDVQQVVRGEQAKHIDGLVFSQDGRRLYFRAQHEDSIDLHWVEITTGAETADTENALGTMDLHTLYSGETSADFAVSSFTRTPRVLYATCAGNDRTARVWLRGDEQTIDPSVGSVGPIGWLPDDSAIFMAYEARCDDFGQGDLYTWKGGVSTLLVENVDAAAVRAQVPTAPDPPAAAQGVVA